MKQNTQEEKMNYENMTKEELIAALASAEEKSKKNIVVKVELLMLRIMIGQVQILLPPGH